MSDSRAERQRARKIIVKEQKLAAAQRARADSTQRPEPVIGHASIEYTVAERTRAIGVGGIGALDLLVQKLGLAGALNELDVLKRHLPYHESDHILTLVYNLLCGGTSIEDVRILRSDPSILVPEVVQRTTLIFLERSPVPPSQITTISITRVEQYSCHVMTRRGMRKSGNIVGKKRGFRE